jgi:hypothetical protein
MKDAGANGMSLLRRLASRPAMRILRKVAVALAGGIVVLLGLVLIVLPGPAIVVIPFGVAILATEFIWAQRLLLRIRTVATRNVERVKRLIRPRLARVVPETSASRPRGPTEP